MKRVYLLKRLDYRNGQSLNPHVPLPATFSPDRNLWLVNGLPVLPKFVEKTEEVEVSA